MDSGQDTRVTFSVPEFVDREIKKERELTDTKMAATAKALELAHANQLQRTITWIAVLGLLLTVGGLLLHFLPGNKPLDSTYKTGVETPP